MALQQRSIFLFVVAATLRLAVFYLFSQITAVLSEQVEIATPVSSYKRLLEGLFLYERGVSPYDGGVYHQAPLLLLVFQFLPSAVVFTSLDLLNAYNIAIVAERLTLPSPRFRKLDGSQLAVAYLFNPFTILSCLGQSTTVFTNAAIIQAIASASIGNTFSTMFTIAVGTYFSLYPALLLPPLILLWAQAKKKQVRFQNFVAPVGVFVGTLVLLLSVSALLVGGFRDFLVSCYGAQITVTDLTPNIGLWWYFFIEIFEAFRNFFIGVFWIHLIGYVGALTIRLPEQPLFVISSLVGLITIFKPYPSISDVSLYLGLLPLYKHIMPGESGSVSYVFLTNSQTVTRYTFVAASVLLYTTLLGPAFYHIWIYAGSGNANFFYAITLVWSLGLSMLIGDSLFAVLRDEWEMIRPEMRGKEVRQI